MGANQSIKTNKVMSTHGSQAEGTSQLQTGEGTLGNAPATHPNDRVKQDQVAHNDTRDDDDVTVLQMHCE
jgi:hypothetical protein